MNSLESQQFSKRCWNEIGVKGDFSCQQLKAVIHCHNCPVYCEAGRSLFNREIPLKYLEDWTRVVAETSNEKETFFSAKNAISSMIFRLGGELLSIPVKTIQEIVVPTAVHSLPHRSDRLFLGLTNIRGETLICISLAHLLSLPVDSDEPKELLKRMIVAGNPKDRWVFLVDEVFGVHRFSPDELNEAPVVITKATETYSQLVGNWQGQKVNFLDAELIFYTLNRKILEG